MLRRLLLLGSALGAILYGAWYVTVRNTAERQGEALARAMLACRWNRAIELADEGAIARLVFGRSPLLYALERKQFRLAELLIKRGADVGAVDRRGRTPLAWALHWADSASGTFSGFLRPNSLQGAEREEAARLVYHLLPRCRSVDVPTGSGTTPLIWSIKRGDEPLARWLLPQTAGLNTVDGELLSALCWAVRTASPTLVKMLRDQGADPNNRAGSAGREVRLEGSVGWDRGHLLPVENRHRRAASPLGLAVRRGNPQVVQTLLRAGANPNRVPRFLGGTVTDEAAVLRNSAVVRLLLDAGAAPPDSTWTARRRALARASALRLVSRKTGR